MGCASSATVTKPRKMRGMQTLPLEETRLQDGEVSGTQSEESQRYDPAVGTAMTYEEARVAFAQAQMTEAQIYENWRNMLDVHVYTPNVHHGLAKAAVQSIAIEPCTKLAASDLQQEATAKSTKQLRIIRLSGDHYFDGAVPKNWSIGQLKGRIVHDSQSGVFASVQLGMNGELLSDEHLVSHLPSNASLCLV